MADTSEPAFPRYPGHNGMTLRDYFAGQALAGLCSQTDRDGTWSWHRHHAVNEAYAIADEMLAVRKK